MHICFLTTGNIRQIATMKRALGMANHMADLGWRVSIVALDCIENREQVGRSCDGRIDIRYFPESGPLMEVTRKSLIVRALAPDVLYHCSYSFRNRVWRWGMPRKIRNVVEHSELFSSIRGVSALKRRMAAYFEGRSIRVSQDIVCASRYLTDHFSDCIGRLPSVNPRIHYLPYAFPEWLASESPVVLDRLRLDYAGRVNIVYMGSLIRDYGLFVMLEAFRQLKSSGKPLLLHLLGEGPDEPAARRFVAEKGLSDMVHFAGYVPEPHLSSWFHLADAFLAPLFDTVQDHARCPSKTYMYLAFGKPVITCRIGESAVLFDDPRLFFRPGDASDLAQRIRDISVDPSCSLPCASRHNWSERASAWSAKLLGTHDA
jgi:glycosyltransferase involved in cell wall biosynthesis